MNKLSLLLIATFTMTVAYSQPNPKDTLASNGKRKIDHTHYDDWNTLSGIQQTKSGAVISYTINPSVGDGKLYLEKIDGSLKKEFNRGQSGSIHFGEQFFVYGISAQHDTIRQMKLDEVSKDGMPKDSMGIYWLASDSLRLIENVKSFKLSEEGDWLAFLSTEDLRPDCPTSKKKKKKKKKPDCEKSKTSGKTLTVYNPVTGVEKVIDQVVDYEFNRQGSLMVFSTSLKGDKDTLDVNILDLSSMDIATLLEKQLAIKDFSFDYAGTQLCFLATPDTNKKKNYDLHYWIGGTADQELKTVVLVDSGTTNMPEGWTVSQFSAPYFSKDGSKLYLGTNQIVRQEPEDTLLASEKAKVDVWSWTDDRIQPEQLKRKKRDEEHAFMAVVHLADKKFVQLETEKWENIYLNKYANRDIALVYTDEAYRAERSWTYPWREDVYYMDLKSGSAFPLAKGLYDRFSLSPAAESAVWFDVTDSCWYGKHINEREVQNLTKSISANFIQDNNGQPSYSYSFGMSGWMFYEGKEYAIINSEYDVYAIAPTNPDFPILLTDHKGTNDSIRYRLWNMDKDSIYVDLDQCMLHGQHQVERWESLSSFFLDPNDHLVRRTELLKTDHQIIHFQRAKESDQLFLRRMSFYDYPELESCKIDLKDPKKLTESNPQMKDFNWATVERVEWKTFNGLDVKGLLYKPEDFDPKQKYPMIVYYYEKYQDRTHSFYSPRATASIIYPLEYASNGYIVFIPDVHYTPGHPAKSAYDCIVSGTDYLTSKYNWIDTTKMGLQGQSWGGYQTAQLITMTDKYAAAMAGAPVSNMFSAYGGIRWGSGLSREFQYENTQSRIGHTIWERPDLYIENSPVFHLPNVKTPCLIMHNDKDGAVPWYQGIEMFMGLRRLNKPVWMLNYNGDAHNLTKLANKKDLSIRMRQFFDYYLLGADIPKWMKEGVPAVDKGKDYGLELLDSGSK